MKENKVAWALSIILTITTHIMLAYFILFFKPSFQRINRKQIFTVSIVMTSIKKDIIKKTTNKTTSKAISKKKAPSKTAKKKEIKVGKKVIKIRKKVAERKRRKNEEEILQKKLEEIKKEAYLEKALEKLKKQEKTKETVEEAGINVKIAGSNIVDPLLSLYLARLTERIRLNWSLPQPKKGLEAVVDIKISKDGKVLEIKIEKSSGDLLFDKWALDAVRKSFPFDPLPSTYTKGYLEIGVRFRQ